MPRKFIINGPKIRQLREDRERGATQKEFAYEIGVSERTLRKFEKENHQVDRPTLDKIAKAFGIHRDEVIFSPRGPRLISEATASVSAKKKPPGPSDAPIIIPRFDTIYVRVVITARERFSERLWNFE